MKVLVYGGTGSQGSAITSRLLSNGHQPTILTRQPEKAAAWVQKGVQIIQGDLDDLGSLEAASAGQDAIALTIAFTITDEEQALRYGRHAIDAARTAGVRHVVFNTSGRILAEPIGNAGYDVRPKIVDYLKASGVAYTVLQPTTYLENLLGPWTRQGIVEQDTLVYPADADRRIGWLATADLAALIVAALEHPELAPAQFVISGEEHLSGTELAARFSTALGREIRYEALPLETFGTALDAMLGPGAGESVLPGYRLLRDHPERVMNWTDMRPVLEKLPVKMTSVVDWVKQYALLLTRQPVSLSE